MDHNVKFPVFHHMFLELSTLEIHSRHGHKNTSPFIKLNTIATDYLSYLNIFPKFYDTTMNYIMVNSEATNMANDTGNNKIRD